MTTAADNASRRPCEEKLGRATAIVHHHSHTARDAKLEVFIGQTLVLLQVGEGERGSAPLPISRDQVLNLKRLWIDAQGQPLVVGVRLLGGQLEAYEARCATGY